MGYSNYLIEAEDLAFDAIQEGIRRLLLDGLDVRITPVSRNKALIRRHILDAIGLQYPQIDPWKYLASQGYSFSKVYPISDEDALTLLRHRSVGELDGKPVQAIALVAGVAWHLDRIQAPAAWALLGGPDAIAWACKVGQIDTGFAKHPALGFRAGVTPWLDTAGARNFFNPDPQYNQERGDNTGADPFSGFSWGHGMRVSTSISGWHPNGDNGNAFYGVAPKVPHTIVRIDNCVLINDQQDAFAQALNYLVDVVKVDVVNLSMGTFPAWLIPSAKAAVNNAYEKGVILVCAGGQYVAPVIAPAASDRTIAVSATTNNDDQLWATGSHGPEIDWSAPGVNIRKGTFDKASKAFIYEDGGDGTSYSAALSTGAAALWLTYHQTSIDAQYGKTWQRVHAFKTLAKATAKRPAVWGDGIGGTGVLQIQSLLTAPLPAINAGMKEPPI